MCPVRPSMGSHPPDRQNALLRAGEYVVGEFSTWPGQHGLGLGAENGELAASSVAESGPLVGSTLIRVGVVLHSAHRALEPGTGQIGVS
jgi:hypothetical protein